MGGSRCFGWPMIPGGAPTSQNALGMIETKGCVAPPEAADAIERLLASIRRRNQ